VSIINNQNAIKTFLDYNETVLACNYNLKFGGNEFLINNIENYMEYFNMDLPHEKRMAMMLRKLKDDYDEDHSIKMKKLHAETARKNYEKNKDKIKESQKVYYENNKDKIKKKDKEYREKNKEKLSKQHKEYYDNNKEKLSKQKKEYFEKKIKEKIQCDCGCIISKYNKLRHEKTVKHLSKINL